MDGHEALAVAVAALRAEGWAEAEIADWCVTLNAWAGRVAPSEAARSGDATAVARAADAAVGEGPDA